MKTTTAMLITFLVIVGIFVLVYSPIVPQVVGWFAPEKTIEIITTKPNITSIIKP